MKYIGYISTFLLYLFLSTAWSGYALSVLWGWFIVDRFPGTPTLGIASAIGIAMIVRYLTYQDVPENDSKKSSKERIITAAAWSFARPLFALVFGAIVRMFL